MESSLLLAKMIYRFDISLVDEDLDWKGLSRLHIMWWKPALNVRFLPRSREAKGSTVNAQMESS